MRQCQGACGRRRHDRFFAGPKARVCKTCQRKTRSDAAHARRILETYGITAEEYAALVEHQHGVCAACKQPRNYRLNVDHSHKDERDAIEAGISPENAARWSVRGLLCRRCNRVLRDVRDDVDVLYGLAAYLEAWPAAEVLTPFPTTGGTN